MDYTITLTEAENLAMQYIAVDIDAFNSQNQSPE